MTISSSLNAGVMGLNVNATRLATISDNIANSETYGYKRSDVDFSSMVVRQEPSVYSAGGVRATTFKDITSTSALISTGSATDIAVSGNGMVPVTNGSSLDENPADRDLLMVPTGSFSTDQNGFLKTNSGLYLMGWPTDSTGDAGEVSRGTVASLEPINTNVGQLNAEPTRYISLGVNLPAELGATSDPYTLPVEYYDSLGVAQSLNATFTPDTSVGATPYTWNISMTDTAGDGVTSIANFTAVFTPLVSGGASVAITPGTGTTYDAATGEIAFSVDGGPMTMLVGGPNTSNGLTQIGTDFSPSGVTQNGSPIGDLQSVEITEDGFLEAVYNTGFRRTLYQIPIADVPSPNGLEAQGNQAYSISNDSGSLYLWDAGDGPAGTFSGYTLMESNTNIASELTSLIETQRAYSSNAKIIQTVDEMLQETTNLKR